MRKYTLNRGQNVCSSILWKFFKMLMMHFKNIDSIRNKPIWYHCLAYKMLPVPSSLETGISIKENTKFKGMMLSSFSFSDHLISRNISTRFHSKVPRSLIYLFIDMLCCHCNNGKNSQGKRCPPMHSFLKYKECEHFDNSNCDFLELTRLRFTLLIFINNS